MSLMTDEKPTLTQLNILVRDMAATVAFYRRLGIEIPTTGPVWDDDHRVADTSGGPDLEFDSRRFARKWAADGSDAGIVLGFGVSSRQAVDRLYDDLIGAGHVGRRPPHDAFWGARYAIVEDPDGNPVGLMSPIDHAHASAPPAPD
jgi:catechol 2,3-dioxygenase-like lactoylglutathione lyase family enzyme